MAMDAFAEFTNEFLRDVKENFEKREEKSFAPGGHTPLQLLFADCVEGLMEEVDGE